MTLPVVAHQRINGGTMEAFLQLLREQGVYERGEIPDFYPLPPEGTRERLQWRQDVMQWFYDVSREVLENNHLFYRQELLRCRDAADANKALVAAWDREGLGDSTKVPAKTRIKRLRTGPQRRKRERFLERSTPGRWVKMERRYLGGETYRLIQYQNWLQCMIVVSDLMLTFTARPLPGFPRPPS